jgi:hypothetical protein
MKKYLFSFLLLTTVVAFGQKPKKTFDHTEFAKQVVLGIGYSMEGSYIDYNAQQFIILKTGKTSTEISEMAANYKASCEKDLVEIRNQKLPIVVETVDMVVLQDSPYKVADITIHSTYSGRKIDLKLTNCIQTDRTWVLGDHILASGEGVAAPVVTNDNNQTTGLANAIQNSETQEESIKGTSIPTKGYVGTRFTQVGNDPSSQYILHDQIGLPLSGYLITWSGEKKEAVIVYQEPEKLFSFAFDLAICKEANGKKADILNPQNEPNFASWVKKETLRAFYVGGQLYFQAMPGQWYILMSEGAIRKLVNIDKTTVNGVNSYVVNEWVQKLNTAPIGTSGMMLSFKNSMSSLVHEHAEMAEKISLKEEGYQWKNFERLVKEYNLWYDQQTGLPAVNYVFDIAGAAKPITTSTNNTTSVSQENTTTTTTENESSSSTENPSLPAEFQTLIGTWSFSIATVNGKERSTTGYNGDFSYSTQYLDDEMWLGGNPREMTFHADGTLTYDELFVQKREVISSTWSLQTNENEDGTVTYVLWIERITKQGTTGNMYTNFLIKDGVMTFVLIDADVKYLLKP